MPKLQDYQLLLFDFDKTLSNSKRQVSPRTQAALHQLTTEGVMIGLCTGRPFQSIGYLLPNLFPADAVHVLSGGAQVMTNTGKVYWEKIVTHAAAFEIVEQVEKFHAAFLIAQQNGLYANPKMIEYLQMRLDYQDLHIFPSSELQNYSTPIMPVLDAPLEFFNYLNERNDINYKQMRTYERGNADVTAKGVNKATGLFELSQLLNIPTSKMIGVGDSENDDEFLQAVGYNVAMGNATPYLKSIAKRVIGHTDEDGLAIYLESIAQGADL